MKKLNFKELKNRIKLPSKKWLVFSGITAASLILAIVFMAMFSASGKILRSQQVSKAWAGNSGVKYAQVSVFTPADSGLDKQKILAFRDKLVAATSDTMPENVTNVYTDAWSTEGKVSIAGDHGKTDASVIAVGGNYFAFHDLTLVSGSFFSDDDVMQDRVILDEELAWKLFGAGNLAGMTVTINDKPFIIAGVVSREQDKYDKSAYDGGAGLYMPIDTYTALSPTSAVNTPAESTDTPQTDTPAASAGNITCYEVVMPNPVTGFAQNLATTELNADGKNVVVENSARYLKDSIFKVLKGFNTRTLRTDSVELPYYENAARLVENRCALLMLLYLVFWLCPVVFAVIMLVKLYKYLRKKARAKYADLKFRYEERTLFRRRKGNDADGPTDA